MSPARTGLAEPDPAALLHAALLHAAHGRRVFPCVPDEKRPLTQHGLHDASADADRIRAWWRRAPTANVAVRTGATDTWTSFDVLDVDVHPGPDGSGFPAYHRLHRTGVIDGPGATIATPSGGMHLYFTGTDQPSARLARHHIDFKASGGYVLAPPSVVGGRRYELIDHGRDRPRRLTWAHVRGILEPDAARSGQLAHLPSQSPPHTRRIDVLADWVSRLPEGERNTGTFWAACRAAEQGHTDLRPIVRAAVTAGLPASEAARTVASAARISRPPPAHRALTTLRPPGRGR